MTLMTCSLEMQPEPRSHHLAGVQATCSAQAYLIKVDTGPRLLGDTGGALRLMPKSKV
jgi:hypothetical protein